MPEIAEVERACGILRRVGLNKVIRSANALGGDAIVYKPASAAAAVEKQLSGARIRAVERYGKYFYLTTDRKQTLLMHLGMAGAVQVRGEGPAYYRRAPKGFDAAQWPPRFAKLTLQFEDGREWAFMDSRRFGRIRLLETDAPMEADPLNKLGFDPIRTMPALADFSARLLRRATAVKAVLLDQTVFAGVGNWVADEILYQSRVHPAQSAKTLTEAQLQQLYEKTIHVCKTAVQCGADHRQFPEWWLFTYRWGKGKDRWNSKTVKKAKKIDDKVAEGEGIGIEENESEEDDERGSEEPAPGTTKSMPLEDGSRGTLRWITVGGRTTAFVEELQILPTATTGDAKSSKQVVVAKAEAKKEEKAAERKVGQRSSTRKRKSMG